MRKRVAIVPSGVAHCTFVTLDTNALVCWLHGLSSGDQPVRDSCVSAAVGVLMGRKEDLLLLRGCGELGKGL